MRKLGPVDRAVVETFNGEPALVIFGAATITDLQRLLEREDSRQRWSNGESLRCAELVVPAARAAVALSDLMREVPMTEPVRAQKASDGEELITTKEAAQRLGITTRAVTKRIAAGRLPARRVGRTYLIALKELGNAAA